MDESNRDPNWFWTFFVGLIGTVILVLIVIALQTWYYAYEKSELEEKVFSKEYIELANTLETQHQNLNAYRWIDPASGIVSIPIELAMQRVVEESGSE